MRGNRTLNLVALAACCCACSTSRNGSQPVGPAAYDSEVIAVYQVVLLGSPFKPTTVPLVIAEATNDAELARYVAPGNLKDYFPGIPADAIDRFTQLAQSPTHHLDLDELATPHVVLTEHDKEKTLRNGYIDYDLFFAQHKGAIGLVTLSQVAFSNDRQWALVYVSLHNGSLGGFGNVCTLHRSGDSWQIVGTNSVWVS